MGTGTNYFGCNILSIVLLFSIVNVCLCYMESSSETLIKEDDHVTFWCSSGMEGGKCVWESPTEEKCTLIHKEFGAGDKSNCMNGATAAWSAYGMGNCTITVTSDAPERNGDWKCMLNTEVGGTGMQSEGMVNLKIAKPARVEVTEYGTLHLTQGEEESVECTAERGQPLGEFIWKIGEDSKDESATIWNIKEDPVVEVDEEGLFTVTQKIVYTAHMAHSGKKLHCIYEQRDMEGNNLFEGNQDDEDEVLIIVRYLEPSTNNTEWLPHAQEGQNYEITKYFKASPMPDASKGEIFWEIQRADETDSPQRYPLPDIDNTVNEDYIIKPLENAADKHVYIARLTILDPNSYDEEYKYTLKIQRKGDDEEDETLTETVRYEFQLSVESDGGDGNELPNDVTAGAASMTTTIVVVIIVVILLIIGIAVGLFYARKKQLCCFASVSNTNIEKGGAENITLAEDQMTTQPLNYGEGFENEGDKTTRPIIKAEWARPQ